MKKKHKFSKHKKYKFTYISEDETVAIIQIPALDYETGLSTCPELKTTKELLEEKENIDEYFNREVLPYAPDAWIDTKKTKMGYEIPMTRYFYEYQAPEKVEDIMTRIHELENDIQTSLNALFGNENS